MKHLILIFIIILCSCSVFKSNIKNINGNWIPIKQIMGGNELPSTFYNNQQLIITKNEYLLKAESIDKGTLVYKNGKMDIYGKVGPNADKHYTAIYKLENNLLTICYNLKGDVYPTSFETNSVPTLFLSVFKRDR